MKMFCVCVWIIHRINCLRFCIFKIVHNTTLGAWILIALDDICRNSYLYKFFSAQSFPAQRVWITIATNNTTTLDAIATYIFLGRYLIAVFVLFVCSPIEFVKGFFSSLTIWGFCVPTTARTHESRIRGVLL